MQLVEVEWTSEAEYLDEDHSYVVDYSGKTGCLDVAEYLGRTDCSDMIEE